MGLPWPHAFEDGIGIAIYTQLCLIMFDHRMDFIYYIHKMNGFLYHGTLNWVDCGLQSQLSTICMNVLPANIWNMDFYRYHLQLIRLELTVLIWFVVPFLLWSLHLFEWDVVMVVLCDSLVPRNLSHLSDAAVDVKHQPPAYYLYW